VIASRAKSQPPHPLYFDEYDNVERVRKELNARCREILPDVFRTEPAEVDTPDYGPPLKPLSKVGKLEQRTIVAGLDTLK